MLLIFKLDGAITTQLGILPLYSNPSVRFESLCESSLPLCPKVVHRQCLCPPVHRYMYDAVSVVAEGLFFIFLLSECRKWENIGNFIFLRESVSLMMHFDSSIESLIFCTLMRHQFQTMLSSQPVFARDTFGTNLVHNFLQPIHSATQGLKNRHVDILLSGVLGNRA